MKTSCVWYFMCVGCGNECKCFKYLSMRSDEGRKILHEYSQEVDKAIEPIQAKWKQRFMEGE